MHKQQFVYALQTNAHRNRSTKSYGYENIDCNLSESSFTDQRLSDLGININDLVLFYGDHKGKPALRELIAANTNLHADDVLITAGAAAALFIVATSLLEREDHVVVAKNKLCNQYRNAKSNWRKHFIYQSSF